MGLADLKKLIREKQFSQDIEHIIPTNLLELDNEIEIQKLGFEDKKDLDEHWHIRQSHLPRETTQLPSKR